MGVGCQDFTCQIPRGEDGASCHSWFRRTIRRVPQSWKPIDIAQFLRPQGLLGGQKMSNQELPHDYLLVLQMSEETFAIFEAHQVQGEVQKVRISDT